MAKVFLVEVEDGSLPSHWSELRTLSDGRRVMDEFESSEEARRYRDKMYGMYKEDAEILSSSDV